MTEEFEIPANIIVAIIVLIILVAGFLIDMIYNLFVGRTICKVLFRMVIPIFVSGGPVSGGIAGGLTTAGTNVGCDLIPF